MLYKAVIKFVVISRNIFEKRIGGITDIYGAVCSITKLIRGKGQNFVPNIM